jgi:hypothetical protein
MVATIRKAMIYKKREIIYNLYSGSSRGESDWFVCNIPAFSFLSIIDVYCLNIKMQRKRISRSFKKCTDKTSIQSIILTQITWKNKFSNTSPLSFNKQPIFTIPWYPIL